MNCLCNEPVYFRENNPWGSERNKEVHPLKNIKIPATAMHPAAVTSAIITAKMEKTIDAITDTAPNMNGSTTGAITTARIAKRMILRFLSLTFFLFQPLQHYML